MQLTGATHGDVTDLPCIAPALGPMAKLLGLGTIGRAGTTTTRTVVRRFLDTVLDHDAATPSAARLTWACTVWHEHAPCQRHLSPRRGTQ